MFLRFFRSSSPSAYIFLPLLGIALWWMGLLEPVIVSGRYTMPLYELVSGPLVSFPAAGMITAFILVVSEGLILNYIVNENEVLARPSFLPALFYILLMSNSNAMLAFHPLIPANLFLLFALNKLMSSYRKNIAFSQSFDAGFLIAIATLFYFPYIVFFPLLGIGLIIFRPFNWREWLISFFGVLVPYFFTITIYFWKDFLDYFWYDKMIYPVIHEKTVIHLPASFYALMIIGWGILFLSFGRLASSVNTGAQRTKKGMILFVWFFLLAGLSVLIAPEISARYFSALAIPASVFYANFFLFQKRAWIGELLFLLFTVTIFVNMVIHYF